LIKGLLQLIKPVQGSVSYSAGLDRGSIGYLSQAAAAKKDFPAGVWEIVLSGNLGNMGLRPFYSRLEKQRALENLARLSIADLKECCYRELSGGQQRRVLIARALSAAQKLLILDEPAAGLDPLVTESLYQLLQKINQEMGITIVMVSHDMAAVEKYAGNIIRLER
jgi:zinc transport system ATP-binding protein